MNVINDVVKDSLYENNEQTESLADNVARLRHDSNTDVTCKDAMQISWSLFLFEWGLAH